MGWENFSTEFINLLDNWAFRLVFILIILGITSLIAKLFNFIVTKYFQKSTHHLNIDKTRFSVMSKLISALIYVIGIAVAGSVIPTLRTASLSLLTGAGVLAAILGFSSQQALSNVISGIFIAIFKPFRVGDRIEVGRDIGDVEDITLRDTIIRDFENKRIIIPNSIIGNEKIINHSIADSRICKHLYFGISYDSNIDKATKIIQQEAVKHPFFLDKRTEEERKNKSPAVVVRVVDFAESSIRLRAEVWTTDPTSAFKMGCDLRKKIKERFDREGVEIPFPYRTIVQKKMKL